MESNASICTVLPILKAVDKARYWRLQQDSVLKLGNQRTPFHLQGSRPPRLQSLARASKKHFPAMCGAKVRRRFKVWQRGNTHLLKREKRGLEPGGLRCTARLLGRNVGLEISPRCPQIRMMMVKSDSRPLSLQMSLLCHRAGGQE